MSKATGAMGGAAEDAGPVAEAPFGAVLAGGQSTRYGAPKALVTVGGRRIIDRVIDALRQVTPDLILSANEPGRFDDLALPTYPDERPDLGPLGGIYTTLRRAREAGRPGILAVACDMPFPSVELLSVLRREAFGAPDEMAEDASTSTKPWGPDIVLPASRGPRGVEPLFAAYSVACIPAIDAALADGDRRMIGFHERVAVHTIPLAEVDGLVDPERAFLNVNSPADRERAEALLEQDHG